MPVSMDIDKTDMLCSMLSANQSFTSRNYADTQLIQSNTIPTIPTIEKSPDYWRGLTSLSNLLACGNTTSRRQWFDLDAPAACDHWPKLCWLWFFMNHWSMGCEYVETALIDWTHLIWDPGEQDCTEIFQTIEHTTIEHYTAYLAYSSLPDAMTVDWMNEQKRIWQTAIQHKTNGNHLVAWREIHWGLIVPIPMIKVSHSLRYFIRKQLLKAIGQQLQLSDQVIERIQQVQVV